MHLLSGKGNHIHPIITHNGEGPECNIGRIYGEGLTQQICAWNDGQMATMESASLQKQLMKILLLKPGTPVQN